MSIFLNLLFPSLTILFFFGMRHRWLTAESLCLSDQCSAWHRRPQMPSAWGPLLSLVSLLDLKMCCCCLAACILTFAVSGVQSSPLFIPIMTWSFYSCMHSAAVFNGLFSLIIRHASPRKNSLLKLNALIATLAISAVAAVSPASPAQSL